MRVKSTWPAGSGIYNVPYLCLHHTVFQVKLYCLKKCILGFARGQSLFNFRKVVSSFSRVIYYFLEFNKLCFRINFIYAFFEALDLQLEYSALSLSRTSAATMGRNDYLHPPPHHCQSPSSPEAEFLGVVGTKVLRVFILAIHSLALTIMKSRKLHSLALR